MISFKMMKLHVIYLTLWSLSHAAHINRMSTVNRLRAPTAFRPGVTLQRPWTHQRLIPAASHRAPYVIYRNSPHRYGVKHYGPSVTRNFFTGGPWKTTARLPPMSSATSEYEFVKAASAPTLIRTNGAPNLSLSEKPIVVIDASENIGNVNPVTPEMPKATYEVTEKYVDLPVGTYQMAKIEAPIGFSKATSLTSPELQALVRNGAALQLASEFGLSAIALPQQSSIMPQQFTMQGFNGIPAQHDLIQAGAEGIVIPPNLIYQNDPTFLHKLQNQLLQRYPAVEFIPYAADVQSQVQVQHEPQQTQQHLFVLGNDQVTKKTPSSFVPSENQKNIVQRETQESVVVTLVPQELVVQNVTERQIEVTSTSQPENVTVELVASESNPATTTTKYIIENNTQDEKTTPIYYAQVGQTVGNAIANGFYSAINDVRAAAALVQVEKPFETANTQTVNVTTTTIKPEIKAYFLHKTGVDEKNQTVGELKPLLGVPFAKTAESVNVAYTLHRSEDKEPKVTKDGAVYAGQIVEATISDDQDFNKEKANLFSQRPLLRLFAVRSKENDTNPIAPTKVAVVKAKIPPKSTLTFDDKTGEPVLRIYASYVDSPLQKEIITSKLANIKHVKEVGVRKQDSFDNWKAATVKTVDKTQGADANQVTQFGLKLRARNDDYIPIFEEYED